MQSTASPEGPTLNPFSGADVLSTLEQYDDVVSWINDVLDPTHATKADEELDAATSLVDLDRRVSSLVGVLEVASEDTSSQVERLIDAISRGAARLTYDLHFMREGAISLQSLLHDVETKTKTSVAADTSAALDQLHLLDRAKHNMIAAREVLREAESWSTLESDVTSLLSEHNYEKAAERLSEANKSMVVFHNTPEYDNRRTLMVSLQNQLEASLSSALVAAVNSQDVVVCRNYFSIFCNIQRESEFRNYYYGSRRAPLTEAWQGAQFVEGGDVTAGTTAITFAQFLATFYNSFVSVLQTERTSIPAIFPDPQPTLATLITSTLSALQPTFSQRLSSLSAHYGSTALPELIRVYKATEEFAVSAEKILEKIGYSLPLSPNPNGERPTKHSRRRSSRLSISGRMNLPSSSGGAVNLGSEALAMLDWDQDLFEPFVDFQVDYSNLERKLLTNALQGIMNGDVQTSTDRSRLLRERSVDVFSVAEESITRCVAFTHGYGFVSLVRALDGFFAHFAEQSKGEIAERKMAQGGQLSTSASGDLSDLDYTSEDWSEIQSLLHLLEAVRTLKERLGSFEGKLRGSLGPVSNAIQAARQNPVGFDVSGTTRGAIQLLAQSTLNSAELQAMLSAVEPSSQGHRNDNFLTPATPDPRRTPLTPMHPLPTYQPPLLIEAYEALSNFAKACQIALQDTILRPLRKRLASYPSLSMWSQTESKSKRAGGTTGSALSEVHVPTFSLSPTETIQRVAEGLLNLPRLFEVYADDDALSFSLETLPFVTAELLKSLAEPVALLPTQPPNPHSRRSPSLSLKTTPPAAVPAAQPPHPEPEYEFSPESVSAIWLSSLSLSLLSHLTGDVLPSIRTLSSGGASQLASDLGYLSRTVMALNVESEELERWKEFVEVDDQTGKARVKENGRGDAVLNMVARLRGWNV
ncbi:unnamed protein product [Somion occarium]|uniref:Conserved oligomeric Golgi complex subunit 7 n=1 Tax=Somion occarium TaxID=3059160 RepID=A0ABP1DNE2_9APHY